MYIHIHIYLLFHYQFKFIFEVIIMLQLFILDSRTLCITELRKKEFLMILSYYDYCSYDIGIRILEQDKNNF